MNKTQPYGPGKYKSKHQATVQSYGEGVKRDINRREEEVRGEEEKDKWC